MVNENTKPLFNATVFHEKTLSKSILLASTRCLNKKYTNSQQSKFLTMLTQIIELKINELIQLKSYPELSTNSQ